jgi:4'-phosphopantetheinyl transferase
MSPLIRVAFEAGRRAGGSAGVDVEIHVIDLRHDDLFRRQELSEGEALRAARFSTPLLERRFVASRVALRRLLRRQEGACGPGSIALVVGPHGKPRVACGALSTDIRFNIARSKDTALIALTRGIDVGVDLESSNPALHDPAFAETILNLDEKAVLRRLPEVERAHALGRCWVRKEAILKALGTGLLRAPASIVTLTAPDRTDGELTLDGLDGEPNRIGWHDVLIDSFDGFAAVAFCARGL